MPLDFSPYRAVLLDLDGTIYHENHAQLHARPGAIEMLNRLQSEKRKFACLSNSADSPLRVMMRLSEMGVEIDPTNIYTAAAAACDYVIERFSVPNTMPAGGKPRIFNLATESIDEMLEGLVDWTIGPTDPCDAIIAGPPTSAFCTTERQRIALQLARNGAAIVGICADRVYPSPRGIEFGSGAISWMLAYAAAVNPVFSGKPEKIFFHELCRRLEVDPTWCILIGDNLESDIYGAKSIGMRTILTLGGVSREQDLANIPAEFQPDLIVKDLRELV